MKINKAILIALALIGIFLWNIPNTSSIFYGQHTFYNGSAPCQKCHQDIQDILDQPQVPYPEHNAIGCQGCHTRDGNTSHAAKIAYCSDCHRIDTHHTINNSDCNSCHVSHGGFKIFNKTDAGYKCTSCHDIN